MTADQERLKGFTKTHLPCPCGKSSDAYAERADGSGFCFGSCGGKSIFPDNYRPHNCKPEPLGERGIPAGVSEIFRFEALRNDKGHVLFYKYHYPNGVTKYRRVADKFHWWDAPKGVDTPALGGIGMYDMPANKTCVVVEGEIDAPSAYYMLNDKMANETPVYWLTSATISHKARPAIFEELNKYDRIIMAFEDDDAGKKAKEVLASMMPEKIRIASLNKHKDANDYLVAGDVKVFKRSVANYAHYTPDYITSGLSKFEDVWKDTDNSHYIPTPFAELNKLVKGLPIGHTVCIDGPEGIGKTELLRALEWEVLKRSIEEDFGVAITHFEEDNKTTLAALGCYDQNRNFRDADVEFKWEEIEPTLKKFDDNMFLVDFYKARDEMSVESFMSKIMYLAKVCGVKYFFLDPINQLRPDAANQTLVQFLDGISMELARFCVDHRVCVVYTAHTNDEGQTRDSRMLAKAASIRLSVARDAQSFDEEIRNRTDIEVTKNRPYSKRGPGGSAVFEPSLFTLVDSYTTPSPLTKLGGTTSSVEDRSKIPF